MKFHCLEATQISQKTPSLQIKTIILQMEGKIHFHLKQFLKTVKQHIISVSKVLKFMFTNLNSLKVLKFAFKKFRISHHFFKFMNIHLKKYCTPYPPPQKKTKQCMFVFYIYIKVIGILKIKK